MVKMSIHMEGRKYHVVYGNNLEATGQCVSYNPLNDNEPEIDSIWIEDKQGKITEIYEPDIKSIEQIL